jgi:hypothetical protein
VAYACRYFVTVAPDRTLMSSLLEEALLLQHVIDDLQDLAVADAGELRPHKERVHATDPLAQIATARWGSADTAGVIGRGSVFTLRLRA